MNNATLLTAGKNIKNTGCLSWKIKKGCPILSSLFI
jgi:hypothetical protein